MRMASGSIWKDTFQKLQIFVLVMGFAIYAWRNTSLMYWKSGVMTNLILIVKKQDLMQKKVISALENKLKFLVPS